MQVVFISDEINPLLEIKDETGAVRQISLNQYQRSSRCAWVAKFDHANELEFRILLESGDYVKPHDNEFFQTPLKSIWVQEQQLFNYEPAADVSLSQVKRVDEFTGRLSARPLYIYLPRGYESHSHREYPILYMHDGQNVFEAFVDDSYAGSWQADVIADRLIENGQMPECIIVGISHGGEARIKEYLPPYSRLPIRNKRLNWIRGRANKTADYYIKDVAIYMQNNYRVKAGRQHVATCGSSMGGLFSLFLAWDYPDFAKNHAAMSPSIWTTINENGKYETIERLRRLQPPDIRLWIDSGTVGTNGEGDDGQVEAVLASEILLEKGFVDGQNLQHYLDRGADHSEHAWSQRFDRVLRYLFPINGNK